MNLMKEQFQQESVHGVIEFNPWMFSGSEDLVGQFFAQISASFTSNNAAHDRRKLFLAQNLLRYARILSPLTKVISIPLVSAGIEVATNALDESVLNAGKSPSLAEVRGLITEDLARLEKPVVILVDDIDRLSTSEIREIFKFVRLTGNFPNLIYVLAFDRERVEEALSDGNPGGRAYLDKILQLSYTVPRVPREHLQKQLLQSLEEVTDERSWNKILQDPRIFDVFWEILNPLFSSLRDVSRFELAARPVFQTLTRQMNPLDLVVLESLKILRPDLMSQLGRLRGELGGMTNEQFFSRSETEVWPIGIRNILERFPDDQQLLTAVLDRIFAAARGQGLSGEDSSQLLRDRRVGASRFFSLYLEGVPDSDLRAFSCSKQLFVAMNDASSFSSELGMVADDDLQDVVGELRNFRAEFSVDTAVPASIAILNSVHRMPWNGPDRGLLGATREQTVRGVVRDLLAAESEPSCRQHMVDSIWRSLTSYSSKFVLWRAMSSFYSFQEFSEVEVLRELAERLCNEFLTEPPADRESEWDAARVLAFIATVREPSLLSPILANPEVSAQVLNSARFIQRPCQSVTRETDERTHLQWNSLVAVFGTSQGVLDAVDTAGDLIDEEVAQLAQRIAESEQLA